jgi:ornithine carbamoyltransferase
MHFLTLSDLSPGGVEEVLKRAVALKSGQDPPVYPLTGKSIGLLFEKASTRTRISFQAGIHQLGGQAIYLNASEIQIGRGETVEDTARVLSRYLHAIVIRTFFHETVERFAAHSSIPVINGLTDMHHPCQALADLMTIREKKGKHKGIRLAYIGDGNNVANSLIEAASITGISLTLACPSGFEPDRTVYEASLSRGSSVTIVNDTREAAKDADVLYTDVWVSMGQEREADLKKKAFQDFQINRSLLGIAKSDAIVMHCLPAHRGEEITDDVIDSDQSVVLDQAENRLHTQKALLEMLVQQ